MDFCKVVQDLILLSDYVPNLLGEKPCTLSPLVGGHVSVVYRAVMPNGISYVLKFAENSEELHHERLFLAAWAENGVRTPNVLQYSRLPDNLHGALLLMEYVQGDNLLPLVIDEAVDGAKVSADLGRILAKMHQVTTTGFGQVVITPDGIIQGDNASLDASLRTQAWNDVLALNLHNGDLLDSEKHLVDVARDLLVTHWQKPAGCLIHDDFRAGNVLYNPAHAEPYVIIDPHPAISHPYLCLAYSLILPEIHDMQDHSIYIQQGYDMISPIEGHALRAARFLKALELLPTWGQPSHHLSVNLRHLFRLEKSWEGEFSTS